MQSNRLSSHSSISLSVTHTALFFFESRLCFARSNGERERKRERDRRGKNNGKEKEKEEGKKKEGRKKERKKEQALAHSVN